MPTSPRNGPPRCSSRWRSVSRRASDGSTEQLRATNRCACERTCGGLGCARGGPERPDTCSCGAHHPDPGVERRGFAHQDRPISGGGLRRRHRTKPPIDCGDGAAFRGRSSRGPEELESWVRAVRAVLDRPRPGRADTVADDRSVGGPNRAAGDEVSIECTAQPARSRLQLNHRLVPRSWESPQENGSSTRRESWAT